MDKKPTVTKKDGIWLVRYTDEKGENYDFMSARSASHAINNWYLMFGQMLGLLRGG